MFYCLVAGSRAFDDYNLLEKTLDKMLSNYTPDITIVSGGAKGADALAELYAHKKGYYTTIFYPEWNLLGKGAGYIRNRKMHEYISQFEHRGVVCFWDGKSKGTKQNFELAEEYNNQIRIIRFKKGE